MKNEVEGLKYFNEYSKQACQFECAVEKCRDICGCIPWDYPRTDDEYGSVPICDMTGNDCFHQLMQKVDPNVDTFQSH